VDLAAVEATHGRHRRLARAAITAQEESTGKDCNPDAAKSHRAALEHEACAVLHLGREER